LLSKQFALPLVASDGYGHLTQLFTLVGSNVQAIDVERPGRKNAHDLKQRSVAVLHQDTQRPNGVV